VIPEHGGAGGAAQHVRIEFMKKYIADWDASAASSKSAAEMKEKVLR
jgi:hypothetical protein